MSRRSVMKHQFSQVPSVSVPRSAFNRTHGYKTTFDSGYLVPFYVDEVLPGDTFQVRATLFARLLSALQVPVMDNIFMDTHFFFVPNRLVWDNFQRFMGEQKNPEDSTDFLVPQVEIGWLDTDSYHQSIYDYYGIPFVDMANPQHINALPFRAYNLIWNEWFRDENLQDSVPVYTGDGPDDIEDFKLLRRGKRHDYFTSALPWPQKGPSVEIPLGSYADVVVSPDRGNDPALMRFSATGNLPGTATAIQAVGGTGAMSMGADTAFMDPNGTLAADLSTATAVDINSLRLSVQMQRFLEKDARGGTRYTEILRNHFGVISPDARLQRPEYLGGNSVPISVSTVPQTSAAGGQPTPQGNLAAFGLASSPRNSFTKSFVEHGIIIGLVSIRADLTYQQGLNRMFSRQTKHDYYWPVFAHLGEQAVLNKEIFMDAGGGDDDKVFGYQERYAEYRYFPSKITGLLRSGFPGKSLDIWHLSQFFETLPLLNDEFIEEKPPIDRILAVTSEPEFVLDCYIQNKTVRPMPVYSVPGLMDHF